MSIYLIHKYIEMRGFMKVKYFLFLMLLIILVGCNQGKVNETSDNVGNVESMQNTGWDINGYIVDIKDKSQKLIVWGIDEDEIAVSDVENILKKADPNAMWVSTKDLPNSNSLNIGDKVFVWIGENVDASYPSYGEAIKIEIDEDGKKQTDS